MTRIAWLAMVALLAAAPAYAQPGEAPPRPPSRSQRVLDLANRALDKLASVDLDRLVGERLGRAAIGRTRRAIAVGPHVGAFEQIAANDAATGAGVAFGLGLYVFDAPVGLHLKEIVVDRVKAVLRERALSGDPSHMLREVIDEVIHEVLDGGYGSPTLQRPKLSIVLEGQTTFGDADGFGARLAAGFGISRVSLGLSAAVQRADGATRALFGPEVGVRLTPIGAQRTPVFDVFVRGEVAAHDGPPITVSLGARVLLDVL